MDLDWVSLKFFLQISVQINFLPNPPKVQFIQVESVVSKSGWLTNPQINDHKSVFYYIGFCICVGLGYFSQHINNLYFYDFSLYLEFNIVLDCI